MKILVVCQHYFPEPFRIHMICEEMVARGHDVTVITGLPNYPMGQIYDGYRHGEKRDEVLNGVKIHRCFTVGRRTGKIWRVVNYYSFAWSSTRYAAHTKEAFDVVFVYQLSPVIMANAGIRYAKKHRKKLLLYCLDLWPASLMAGGVRENSSVYNLFRRISGKIYRQASKILITSRLFDTYFQEQFGITECEYLPQYAEALFVPEQCRKAPDAYIDLMFAGNLGTAQSIGTVIKAARRLQDMKRIRWHIVGDGSEYEALQNQAAGLDNVFFYGRKPLEEMPALYAKADAMLVTMQKSPFLSMTLPGKVQSYMAAGKPLIGCIDGEAARVIQDAQCGLCVPAEDAEALAAAVRHFTASGQIVQMGENARTYYEQHFDKGRCMDRLEAVLYDACEERAI